MPRKTLKEIRSRRPTEDNQNRIRIIMNNLIGTENPIDIMSEITKTLTPSGFIPMPGEIYTFKYSAKSPNITYDKHPLVLVTNVYQWGFDGYNFHWGSDRRYTWNEIEGYLYEVYKGELSDMRELPYQYIIES